MQKVIKKVHGSFVELNDSANERLREELGDALAMLERVTRERDRYFKKLLALNAKQFSAEIGGREDG